MVIFIILISGCVEVSKVNQSSATMREKSVNQSSTTLSREENIPEIKVTSFSSIYMHENSENLVNYIFSWDNVPGSESYKLRDYLRNDLRIDWVNNATIIKAADNSTIRVFTPTNSLELKLADNKNTILITPNQIQLKVKEENGKLYIFKIDESDYRIKTEYNITERYYAIYNLSIKNNDPKNLDFKLSDLNLRSGYNLFNVTNKPENLDSDMLDVLSDFEKETKIEDTTLSPGQTINGSVVFQVNSLYNKSFLLMYNGNPIPSTSFEKSIEALKIAEGYNYSIIFGIPPYDNGGLNGNSFEPKLDEYPYIWANWVNRSVFEVFNKACSELLPKEMAKSSVDYMPQAKIVYALEVIPERNITSIIERNTMLYSPENHFIIIDDTGKELINASKFEKIAILKNQNYELHSEENNDIQQMNLSNATVVRISYYNDYKWALFSLVNQDVILSKEQNIIIARNNYCNAIS